MNTSSFFAKFLGKPEPIQPPKVTIETLRAWLFAIFEANAPKKLPGTLHVQITIPLEFKPHIGIILQILTTDMGFTEARNQGYETTALMAVQSFCFQKETHSWCTDGPCTDTQICGGQDNPDCVIIKLYVQ